MKIWFILKISVFRDIPAKGGSCNFITEFEALLCGDQSDRVSVEEKITDL